MMDRLARDVRYAARVLARSPGFVSVAVLTLALGIGLNTAIFSVVNAVLFKPLPVERPEQLVGIYNREQEGIITHAPLAFPDYRDIREGTQALTGAFGYALDAFALDTGGSSELVFGEVATGEYFSTLGVRAAVGRAFTPADEAGPAAAPVVVLSDASWRRRFGADPDVVGRTIRLNGGIYTVIGVAPPEFTGLYRVISPELWVPMRWGSEKRRADLDNRGGRWMFAMARLRPGVTIGQADAEAAAIGKHLQQEYPQTNARREVALVPVNDVTFMPGLETVLYPASLVLLGVVGLVLLIASVNVANMLLARATSRRREFAVRLALGASRGQLVRQLLVESALLALAGAVAGLVLAMWGDAALLAALGSLQLPFPVTLTLALGPDRWVLAYTLGLAAVTTLAFGLAPALEASRADLATTLKDESGTASGGVRKRRLQQTLVVAQVALSLVLLIGAGLSLRSLFNANRVDPGFRPQGVARAVFAPESRGYKPEQSREFFRELLERVRALPEVESAAVASHLPLTFEIRDTAGVPDGKQSLPIEEWTELDNANVGPGYFEAIGIPVVRGRAFEERDAARGRQLGVVNEALAARFWPGEDPVGKRLLVERDQEPVEILGVVRNARYRTLGEAQRPFLYQGYDAIDYNASALVVRTRGDVDALLVRLREISRAVDESVPVVGLQTLEAATSVALLLPRTGAILFLSFGLLGLTLASVGLYGVIAYLAMQRTREIGIRVALGAQRGDIVRMVVGQGFKLALSGVCLGLAVALVATRAIAAVLYGVSATDVLTFATVSLTLLGVAAVACYIPAWRASRLDPMVALRYE
jgi:putative ABC transport system permease protein